MYDERNNGKVTAKYFFITQVLFSKFYLNQTNVTIKKREKFNLRGGKFLSF